MTWPGIVKWFLPANFSGGVRMPVLQFCPGDLHEILLQLSWLAYPVIRKDLALLLARLRKDIKGYSWLTDCLIVLIRGLRFRKSCCYEMYWLLSDCHDWTSDIADSKGGGIVWVQPIFEGKPWGGPRSRTWWLWHVAYLSRRGSTERGVLAGFLLFPTF